MTSLVPISSPMLRALAAAGERAADLPFHNGDERVPSTTHLLGVPRRQRRRHHPQRSASSSTQSWTLLVDLGLTHIEMPATSERVWRAIRRGI